MVQSKAEIARIVSLMNKKVYISPPDWCSLVDVEQYVSNSRVMGFAVVILIVSIL